MAMHVSTFFGFFDDEVSWPSPPQMGLRREGVFKGWGRWMGWRSVLGAMHALRLVHHARRANSTDPELLKQHLEKQCSEWIKGFCQKAATFLCAPDLETLRRKYQNQKLHDYIEKDLLPVSNDPGVLKAHYTISVRDDNPENWGCYMDVKFSNEIEVADRRNVFATLTQMLSHNLAVPQTWHDAWTWGASITSHVRMLDILPDKTMPEAKISAICEKFQDAFKRKDMFKGRANVVVNGMGVVRFKWGDADAKTGMCKLSIDCEHSKNNPLRKGSWDTARLTTSSNSDEGEFAARLKEEEEMETSETRHPRRQPHENGNRIDLRSAVYKHIIDPKRPDTRERKQNPEENQKEKTEEEFTQRKREQIQHVLNRFQNARRERQQQQDDSKGLPSWLIELEDQRQKERGNAKKKMIEEQLHPVKAANWEKIKSQYPKGQRLASKGEMLAKQKKFVEEWWLIHRPTLHKQYEEIDKHFDQVRVQEILARREKPQRNIDIVENKTGLGHMRRRLQHAQSLAEENRQLQEEVKEALLREEQIRKAQEQEAAAAAAASNRRPVSAAAVKRTISPPTPSALDRPKRGDFTTRFRESMQSIRPHTAIAPHPPTTEHAPTLGGTHGRRVRYPAHLLYANLTPRGTECCCLKCGKWIF